MKRAIILPGLFCIIVFSLGGCKSELKDPLPSAPALSGVHPAGWTTPASADFHGLSAKIDNASECKRCHGSDLDGGLANVSCGRIGCHGKGYHPDGFGRPTATNFHKFFIPTINYDLNRCKGCHGTDYAGSTLSGNVSCNNTGCHIAIDGGPQACYTCHGDFADRKIYPQAPVSHITHIEGTTLSPIMLNCQSCHTVNGFSDPNHIGGSNPNGAEVTLLDATAAIKTKGTVGTPQYDYATGSCQNVYCHGNFTNGNNAQPVWKGTDQSKCGTCHGDPVTGNPLPKAPHLQIQTCSVCHAGVVDENMNIVDKTKHINGKLNRYGAEVTDW